MSGPTVLVTLDEVIAHLNLEGDTSLDTVELQGFIDAATAYIQAATGPIVQQTYTEVHSGGGSTICVFHPPIVSVTSIVEYVGPVGYTLTEAELGTPAGAYSFSIDDPRSGIIRRRWQGGFTGPFVGGDHNIVVTYVAGRTEVPADIRMAVLQDIAGLYQPSQLGTNPYYDNNQAGNGPINPIGMFPRVAAILSDTSKRLPGIG